jgi:hypothetical protein
MYWEIYVSGDDCPVGVGCPFAWTELRGALSLKRSLQSAGDISCMVVLPCEINDPSRRVVARSRGYRILINGRGLKL